MFSLNQFHFDISLCEIMSRHAGVNCQAGQITSYGVALTNGKEQLSCFVKEPCKFRLFLFYLIYFISFIYFFATCRHDFLKLKTCLNLLSVFAYITLEKISIPLSHANFLLALSCVHTTRQILKT